MSVEHQPVLLQEAIDLLNVRPGGRYLDGTAGAGGHSEAILRASAPDGRLLALDVDPNAVERVRARLASYGERAIVERANFAALRERAAHHGLLPLHGILLDLGVSSLQLADPAMGLSFQRDDPLDMRLDPTLETTAADLVNGLGERELADLLWRYGEEPASRRIARAIVRHRPIATTGQLAAVVAQAAGRPRGRIHPATRVFQALRIAVNDELGMLERALEAAIEALAPSGRLVVISFHSLEDRLVKCRFAEEAKGCRCPPRTPQCLCRQQPRLRLLTRRPVTPSATEVAHNPRARSAKLRAVERLEAA
ncbi:MAG: 16S rRNA (cytosine(1402)-N(4))-methyltransferase RsmH [Chloroflexota bacterium]|nr:16S rRNA (cytosine(1402)-N(4))-methyltransferase RsmH [Dehalococcoidia bacterium]MDW8253179.1 16S rRNA (cytosine(1402)-N(4))-methyltransferase RsmH [Chloroflexota bacterium]